MQLVNLFEAKSHLNLDDCNENALFLKIGHASDRVIDYIDAGITKYKDADGNFLAIDDDGNWLAPEPVRGAVLLLLGYLWRQRDEDQTGEWDGGELPRPVRAMLRTYRKTVIA